MTIKVQQETFIAIQAQPWPISNDVDESYRFRKYADCQSSSSCPNDEEEYQSAVVEKRSFHSSVSIDADEDDSVYTATTTSSFSSEEPSDLDRRVTFANDLVSDVWTRPYSNKEDIERLYYSNEETQRFRQEYRLERKVLSTLTSDVGLSSTATEDLSAMIESTCSSSSTSSARQHRNGISLVVVLHNDRLETFCDNQQEEKQKTSLSSSSLLLPHVSSSSIMEHTTTPPTKNDFFDTPEFWSGSITWW